MPHRVTPERFWAKVDRTPGHGPNGDCWLWTGYRIKSNGRDSHPYGRTSYCREPILAHRLAWYFEHGVMPPRDRSVCHSCDVGLCCRPSHLFLGTHRDNMADMHRKGRWTPPNVRGERHGMSKFTEAQVLDIRRRHAAGERITHLAQEFNVWPAAISRIVKRLRWAHLPGVEAA